MQLEELVYKNYSSLNSTDLFIWKYISLNKKDSSTQTIDELALNCNVSRTTITRFVRKLGLKGYSEFKVLLSWEVKEKDILSDEAYYTACDSIIHFIESQREKDYDKICKMIYESTHVYVYGSGDIQSSVAKQIKRMFLSCQEKIYDFGGTTFDKSFYNMVGANDVVILISLSGSSEKIISIARNLKLRGCKIIAITELKDNELSNISDEVMYISAAKIDILELHPSYQMTMLYFVLAELLFIKYSIYKKHRMLSEGLECTL